MQLPHQRWLKKSAGEFIGYDDDFSDFENN